MLSLGLLSAALVTGAAVGLRVSRADGDRSPDRVEVPPLDPPVGEAATVPRERITVTATSALAPDGGITYDPENMVDDDLSTAWNSDNSGSDGRGERLTFRFAEPVDLEAVQFVNGYAKSPDLYDKNHRVRELQIQTDTQSQRVTLLDTTDPQEIAFEFGFTSKVVLEILDVYPGSGLFDNPELTPDLALTEVGFIAVQR